MNKRPLCAACILLMLLLALGGFLGIDYYPRLPSARIRTCMQEQKTQEICGRIADYQEKQNSIQYTLNNTILFDSEQQIPLKTFLVYTEKDKQFHIGETVRLKGELEEILPPSNPGMFDARAYYGVQGIFFRCFAEEIHTEEGAKSPTAAERVKQRLREIREKAAANLAYAAGDSAGILQAMALGDKNGLEDEAKSSFQQGGVLHILTISGLHITLIGMGLLKILMRRGCPLKFAAPAALAALILYGEFIGMGSSCVRAVLMFCAALGAKLLRRTYDLACALSLAAILMLLENPAYLYYSGFQLSFGSVACAGLLVPCWEKTGDVADRADTRRHSRLAEAVKSGIRAVRGGFWLWLFLSPLCAYHFYETAPVGIVMNLLIIPALPVLLLSALAAAAAGFFWLPAASAAAFPAVFLLKIMDIILALGRKFPGSVWITGRPEVWKVFLIYGGVLLFLWLRLFISKHGGRMCIPALRAVSAAAAVWVLLLLAPRPPAGLQITMVDVGQGDCFVIRTEDGNCFMIDGGSTSENQAGYYRILPYLKSQGISRIEGIIVTHSDADHMNGITEIAGLIGTEQTALSVGTLYLPDWMRETDREDDGVRELFASARSAGIGIEYLRKGMALHSGRLRLAVLHPDGSDYRGDTNAGSVTLQLEYGDFKGLFTGDLHGEGERLVQEQAVRCDLLKVAHHGSGSSTPREFLQIVRPSICFLSYGKDNIYGHPHPELVQRLEDAGAHVYETAEHGAVTLRTDGRKIEVKKYLTTVEN